jgi:hypothetical protein
LKHYELFNNVDDDGLFGRVARHFHELTAEHIEQRLSFAHQYQQWSKQQWMSVIFSDEKIFTLGHHGQVWVQRPKGQAWNPEYVYDWPIQINLWVCFSGKQIGEFETFEETNTARVMCGILTRHLIQSATAYTQMKPLLGLEPWQHLWDNSPIHTSDKCKKWHHDHGVERIKMPSYSPDLNPTEHLLADLARRVEQHFAKTLEQLVHAIEIEVPLTNSLFLAHLAQSMPARCQAVIANQGHATKY